MSHALRRVAVVLLTLVLAGALAAARPAPARADGGDNVAAAVNTRDGSSLFRLAFSIRKVGGEIVDNTNSAVAVSQCERCRTIAIAVQIVLVTSSPTQVTPQNTAVAVNYQCTLCETFASAYQFVLGTGGRVRFTADGRRELAEIRRELQTLRHSELAPPELQARVSEQMSRLRAVLRSQLVQIGPEDDAGEEDIDEEVGADDASDLPPDQQPQEPSRAEERRTETVTTAAETATTPPPTADAPATDPETAPAATTTTTTEAPAP